MITVCDKKGIMGSLHITEGDLKEHKVDVHDKLYCCALLQQGTTVTQSVLEDFTTMRDLLYPKEQHPSSINITKKVTDTSRTLLALKDIESFLTWRIAGDISIDMASAYKDTLFLVRQHILVEEEWIDPECPLPDLVQEEPKEGCALCGGDLQWSDGQIHAKVCMTCFKKMAENKGVVIN